MWRVTQIAELFGSKSSAIRRKIVDFSPKLKIRASARILYDFFAFREKIVKNCDFLENRNFSRFFAIFAKNRPIFSRVREKIVKISRFCAKFYMIFALQRKNHRFFAISRKIEKFRAFLREISTIFALQRKNRIKFAIFLEKIANFTVLRSKTVQKFTLKCEFLTIFRIHAKNRMKNAHLCAFFSKFHAAAWNFDTIFALRCKIVRKMRIYTHFS